MTRVESRSIAAAWSLGGRGQFAAVDVIVILQATRPDTRAPDNTRITDAGSGTEALSKCDPQDDN
jgi:hypothetical protein